MTQELSERQQRAAERFLEDEGLTEDLTDAPARALITWASEQASTLAGNENRNDDQLSGDLKELRKAVRTAAASGEEDPAALVAQAKDILSQALGITPPSEKTAETPSTPEPQESHQDTAEGLNKKTAAKAQHSTQGIDQLNASTNVVDSEQRGTVEKSDQEGTIQRTESQKAKPKAEEKADPKHEKQKQTSVNQQTSQPSQPAQALPVPDPPKTRRAATSATNPHAEKYSVEERYMNWLDDITDGERD